MTTHTPGPWASTAMGRKVMGFDYSTICLAPRSPNPETAVANFRLIAAAPDLLAALEALWNHLDGRPIPERLESQLSAAIAKAKGQQA